MSILTDLQYATRQGSKKPFVDDKVYTKNRQFRTVLSWKLEYETLTGRLRFFEGHGVETGERILSSFVTKIEEGSL